MSIKTRVIIADDNVHICKFIADYLRKNKYTLLEDDIDTFDENVFMLDFDMEEDVAKKLDLDVCAEEFEKLFTNLNVLKSAKNLSYREKLVLFSYYSERKTDPRIAKELHLEADTVRKIRKRAIKKILNNYYKLIGGNKDVI